MNVSNIVSIVWSHWSFLMGIVGNSFVLYSTIYHRAIKMDKLSVWIIQNLAVTDLVNSFLILSPVIVSLYADSQWVFGETFCKITYIYKYLGFTANVVLINALSFNKMVRCLSPLRNLGCSKSRRWLVTTVTAATSTIIPVFSVYRSTVDDKFAVVFSTSQCMCSSVPVAEIGSLQKILYLVFAGSLNGLPCFTLCAMNTFLVVYALKKCNRVMDKGNIVIVLLVTTSFLVSGLPYFFYSVKHGHTSNNNDAFLRVVTFITFISLWSNPVIYLVTNKHFRTFTADYARGVSRVTMAVVQPHNQSLSRV